MVASASTYRSPGVGQPKDPKAMSGVGRQEREHAGPVHEDMVTRRERKAEHSGPSAASGLTKNRIRRAISRTLASHEGKGIAVDVYWMTKLHDGKRGGGQQNMRDGERTEARTECITTASIVDRRRTSTKEYRQESESEGQ